MKTRTLKISDRYNRYLNNKILSANILKHILINPSSVFSEHLKNHNYALSGSSSKLAMLCHAKIVILLAYISLAVAQNVEDSKLVTIAQGPVRGYRNAEHDIYEFLGIPYATAPNGTRRFTVSINILVTNFVHVIENTVHGRIYNVCPWHSTVADLKP